MAVVHDGENVGLLIGVGHGMHRVYGTVRRESSPAENADVYLYTDRMRRLLDIQRSDSEGRYSFDHYPGGTYVVVGFDSDRSTTVHHPDIVRVNSEPM